MNNVINYLLHWCWNKSQKVMSHFSEGITISQSHTNFAFWILTTLTILIAFLIVVIVIIHYIYKVGFYGRSQPFHTKNDIWHKLFVKKDGFINDEHREGSIGPQWTRHCDVSQTTIVNGDNVSDTLAKDITDFLCKIYSTDKNKLWFGNVSMMTREPSYIIVHRKDLSSSSFTDISPIDCLMTATPSTLLLLVGKGNGRGHIKHKLPDKANSISLPIYTIEYATNDFGRNIKGVHYQSSFQTCFATLHFFQQSNTPQAKVSLFRTNGLIWNIIPLCVFETTTYAIDPSLDYKFNSAKELRFFNAKKENIRSVVDFISKKQKSCVFDVVITKELTDMLGLINNKTLVVVGCVIRSSVIGALFFARSMTTISQHMELCSSVFDDGVGDNIKLACFSRSVILANRVLKASHIDIPGISHNKSIIDMIENRNRSGNGIKPSSISQNAYYLRNYRTHTRKPERCLII